MKCSNCGSNIPGSAKFCGVCGTATQPAEAESALETVAFDPSSDPEFKAAAAKLEAENNKANEVSAAAKKAEPVKNEKPIKKAESPAKAVPKASNEPIAAPSGDESEISEDDDAETIAKKKGKFRETIWFMQAEDPGLLPA